MWPEAQVLEFNSLNHWQGCLGALVEMADRMHRPAADMPALLRYIEKANSTIVSPYRGASRRMLQLNALRARLLTQPAGR